MIGRTISHYRIVEKLGQGGMGIVYLAEDTLLGRRVAFKTLTDHSGDNQHFRARFLREARAVSALSHPHIAHIYDYGETDEGDPYIVMELIKGETLSDMMRKEALTIPQSIDIIKQVAEALGEAHHHGIIHRDIKPSNVAITERGQAKVLDFGLAKQIDPGAMRPSDPEQQTLLNTQTREGVIVGTPMYLSPEQALGVEVDTRSDLFSLGGLLYECISGKPPFIGQSPMEICAKVIRDDPPPPSQLNRDVPASLDEISLKALAKKPEERYQTADEVIAALRAAEEGLRQRSSDRTVTRLISPPSGTQPTGTLATLSDIFKRPRLSVGYVLAGVLVIGMLAFVGWLLIRAKPHKPTTEVQQLYTMGLSALREGNYFKASKLLGEVVKQDDKFILGRARLAEVWAELDYSDNAKDELLRVNALSKSQPLAADDEIYVQAINLKLTGDSAGSIEKFEEISRRVPANEKAEAYIDLARAHERDGNIKKAKEFYLAAQQIDPHSTSAAVHLSVLYARQLDQESTDAALGAFQEADTKFQTLNDVEGQAQILYERGVFFIARRKLSDARNVLSQALSKSDAIGDKYQRVRIGLQISSVSCLEGDTDKALQEAGEVVTFARQNGLESLAANGLINLGNAFMARGDFARAESSLNRSLELAQYYKARRTEGRALLVLASFYTQHQGNAAKVRDLVDRAASINQQEGHRKYTLQALAILGHSNDQLADYAAALEAFSKQRALAEQLQDQEQVALAHEGMGIALSHEQHYSESLAQFDEDARISRTLKLPPNELHAELNRTNVLWRLGRYPEAEKALVFVLDAIRESPNPEIEAWAYLFKAQMALSRGQASPAIAAATRALELSAEEFHEIALESKTTLSLAYAEIGRFEKAKELSVNVVETARQGSDLRLLAAGLLARSAVLLKAGDPEQALAAATEAQAMFERMGQLDSEWQAWLSAAVATRQMTDPSKSKEFANRAAESLRKLAGVLGPGANDSYLSRPDIHRAREQLKDDLSVDRPIGRRIILDVTVIDRYLAASITRHEPATMNFDGRRDTKIFNLQTHDVSQALAEFLPSGCGCRVNPRVFSSIEFNFN